LTITSTTVELLLKEWTDAAGIDKHITYHCSRHTAATLLLTLGANLYVVSKLLGHKSIKMTEVYAKIVDKKKIETMNLVNNMFETA
jgi:site-specific recombinase XerD